MTEEENQEKTRRNEYMRDYYAENKKRILARRKLRYANDPEYKKKLTEQRRRTRQRKRILDKKDLSRKEFGDTIRDKGKPMKIYNNQRTHYAIVRMFTVGRVADIVGIKRTHIYNWIHGERLPEANYVMKNGWRLFTEYEVQVVQDCVRRSRIRLKKGGYSFRMDKRLEEEVKTKLNALAGGVPAYAFTEQDKD